MNIDKLPQLRVLVTDYCDSKCIYCRPGGEGNLQCRHLSMSYDTAIQAATAYRKLGGNSIKISGGDPVFWKHLIQYISFLKNDLQYDHVELITRSVKIMPYIDDLDRAGLDVINFSLDTISEEKYTYITGKHDLQLLEEIIIQCAGKMYCKINTVVLPNTSESEIESMIDFCVSCGIRELKLLDYIDDLQGTKSGEIEQPQQFVSLYNKLDSMTSEHSIAYQGGLGHPMRVYQINDQFKIICKDSSNGAWYCNLCLKCRHYPCHDALMALRVTPSDTFQLCLVNDKMHWKFNAQNLELQLDSIMKQYKNAFFRK